MRKTICTCDRCKKEIPDGLVYHLTCYAEDLNVNPLSGNSSEVVIQNTRQNLALQGGVVDLCKACKDDLTDGLFIV